MAQEYISYIQTEELFKMWPIIQGIKESLEIELQALRIRTSQNEKEDYIYTKVIGNKVLSDMPHSGKLSDTTGDIALSYKQAIKRDYCETNTQLLEEKFHIELVDNKLDIAFKRLSPTQQKILRLFYWQRKTWAEVLDALKQDEYMSRDQAQTQRREAMEKMQAISKITVDMYDYVMKLVGVE